MSDIIDFEEKRKKKFGNQNETEVEKLSQQGEASPDSENNSQESEDLELVAVPTSKMPANKSTQAERLIRLAHENATFFHTPSDEPFGCMQIGNHQEIWSLKSRPFKEKMGTLFSELNNHMSPILGR